MQIFVNSDYGHQSIVIIENLYNIWCQLGEPRKFLGSAATKRPTYPDGRRRFSITADSGTAGNIFDPKKLCLFFSFLGLN